MRWRNMFWFTGQPGWLRFGYSPGWGGLPPGAAYLYQTGQVPGYSAWLSSQGAWAGPWGWQQPWGQQQPLTKEQEIDWLSARAKALEEELSQIKQRLDELTKEGA